MALVAVLGSVTLAKAASKGEVLDEEEADLSPGLLAVYRSLAADSRAAPLVRIDPKPAFTWGRSSPHPRIAPGPFEVRWTGVISWKERKPVRFGAYLGGELTMSVDGVAVLKGRGKTSTAWVQGSLPFARESGLYRIRIRYRSFDGVPARVRIWWQGKDFSREPLPGALLKHLPKELPDTARHEATADLGRAAAGRLGCARCHRQALPAVNNAPPGPSLADLGRRVRRRWLLDWLADPSRVRHGARMPALFTADRQGFVERWLVAEYLFKATSGGKPAPKNKAGDHRAGKQAFLGMGCIACHRDPEKPDAGKDDLERYPFEGLGDRLPADHLEAFLRQPAVRYPDDRMPRMPLTAATARDLAAYLLMHSKAAPPAGPAEAPVRPVEIARVVRRLGAADAEAAGRSLVREKGCVRCHTGLGEPEQVAVPIKPADARKGPAGCLSDKTLPRFRLDDATRAALRAFLPLAADEKHTSAFADGQRLLRRLGCWRCHQRDSDRPAPLEEIGRTVWAPFLYRLPFQRAPRLTQATAKFTPEYLLSAVRDGVSGVRPDWYSYRMPAFGAHAAAVVRALAESDGDLPDVSRPRPAPPADPTLTALGPSLVGFEGYACVSCHVWAGKSLAAVEPGTVGPELTTLTGRVRREWFDRFLEGPLRVYPGTPMPAVFPKGAPASLRSVFGGDVARQKDAIWGYLAQGKKARPPRPRPPIPIPLPPVGAPPLVAQIPVQLPDGSLIEALCVLYGNHDLVLYDIGAATLRNFYTGARLLRQSNVWRTLELTGTPSAPRLAADAPVALAGPRGLQIPAATQFLGYERLPGGVRLRWRFRFAAGPVEVAEELGVRREGNKRLLVRALHATGLPEHGALEVRTRGPGRYRITVAAVTGRASSTAADGVLVARFQPRAGTTTVSGAIRYELPPSSMPKAARPPALPAKPDEGQVGPLERPGYRAIVYPRPKTAAGEDRIMPSALAVHPRDGRVFVASMKLGELLVLRDPHDDGRGSRFDDFTRGLFQDIFGMVHDGRSLYVLHRRNLTRVRDPGPRGLADRFDRVAPLPHAVGNAYDWAYGLVRDQKGRFLFTFAPHANPHQTGSGSLLRLTPGDPHPEEIAFGFRNPLGWAAGPGGEVFFTDNQGDWVATNKLCHVEPGRFYGFPNPARPQTAKKPPGRTAVWVPYDWARSINGLAYDASGGKFGPFAGQFFLAELMNGGAIIRANVERVNGVYQGACFPFWGRGLLGPLTLAFDPKGRLFVGAITTPGWMGQPDRGALFRLDYTGPVPFEIHSIHARPRGFRLVFTRAVDERTSRALASYRIEHYRYEYTGAYGSPELERTRLPIRRALLGADGGTVDLETAPLVRGRVYAISAAGVRSAKGKALVHPQGVYTLHEIPAP
jgi:glucose/arabinose dehydrogenase/cytochrome c551/c552